MNLWIGLVLLPFGYIFVVTMWPLAVVLYFCIKTYDRKIKLKHPSIDDFWISSDSRKEYHQLKKNIVSTKKSLDELSNSFIALEKSLPSAQTRSDGRYDERSCTGKLGNKILDSLGAMQRKLNLLKAKNKDYKKSLHEIRIHPMKIRDAWCNVEAQYLTAYQTFLVMILIILIIIPTVTTFYGVNVEYSFIGWLYNLFFRLDIFFEWSFVSKLSNDTDMNFEDAKTIFLNGGFKQWITYVFLTPLLTGIFFILGKKHNKILIFKKYSCSARS